MQLRRDGTADGGEVKYIQTHVEGEKRESERERERERDAYIDT
jgi:hypothetical protein